MINHYQQIARSTAIYPTAMRFIYPVLGLAGEFGEATDVLLPKQGFIADQVVVDLDDVEKELGDVLWYITNATLDVGLSLQDLASDLTGGLDVKSFKDLSFAMIDHKDARRIFLLFMVSLGPVAEAAKKAIRDNDGKVQEKKLPAVREGLGGMLRAWLQLCERYHVSPDDVAIFNIEKLTRRKDEGKLRGDGDNR